MGEYIVESKSREDLRELALAIREDFGIKNVLWVPIIEMLDVFSELFEGFSYEIVPDTEMPPGVHAETDIVTGHITIRESVYERACDGKGRDRMTIAHEIGHYIMLCYCGFKLQRNYDGREILPYNDPEWQAKCFAGELMMGHNVISGMNLRDIYKSCGVSLKAARYQFDHI